jgi:glycosyltransferase involved in cell wall biosynthesis
MVTTAGQRCGIASYSAALIDALGTLPDTDVQLMPIVVGEHESSHYEQQASQLNASDADLVHIQHEFSFWGFPTPARSRFADFRRAIRRPVVLTAHTTLPLSAIFPLAGERHPWRWLKKKRLLSRRDYREAVEVETFDNDATIVHTDAARREFVRRGLSAEKVFVVPMGIPTAPSAPAEGRAFRDRHRLHGRRLLTLFGYVTPNKGYEMVAQVLPALPPDVTFVIAGGARRPIEEAYVEQLRRHLRNQGVEHRVVITGYLEEDDVANAMQTSEIALVPHTQATNSYSVMLALANGRPTLASDLACFREMAERGNCLELFRRGDADDFRTKVTGLLDDPERRRELSDNARRYAARFAWREVAAMTRSIYQIALDRRRCLVHQGR